MRRKTGRRRGQAEPSGSLRLGRHRLIAINHLRQRWCGTAATALGPRVICSMISFGGGGANGRRVASASLGTSRR